MGFTSNLRDGHLVRRTLAGDSAAFTELVQRHMPAVAAVALAYTRNPADADDVVQEAFVKAWQALDTLRTPRRFGGWTVTIARNVARARHNQVRRDSETLKQFGLEAAVHATRESSDREDHLLGLLPGLLAELSESDRELVLLHYYGGKKTREVAELLTLSHDVVRKRLERIRHKLGQAMLASLEPDSEEIAHRDKRASRIASAVVALPVPWKRAAAGSGIWATSGFSALLKAAVVAAIAVPMVIAGYRGLHGETAVTEVVGRVSADSTQSQTASEELAPPVSLHQVSAQTAAPGLDASAAISGRLLEEDTGNGVLGGTIELQSVATNEVSKASTDESGDYRFDALPPGEYWISLYWDEPFVQRYPRNRYSRQERKINLQTNAPQVDVNFNVIRGLTVRGQVVDPRGKPVPGAMVQGWSVPNTVEATVTTDAEGRFEFPGFGTDAPACFWPRHPGMAMPPHGPIAIPPEGVDGLVLAMRPESAMSGRLTDQFGTPLPGTRVVARPNDVNGTPEEFGGTTDEQGHFALAGLHASGYRFILRRAGKSDFENLDNMDVLDLAEGEQLHDIELVYEIPGDLSISGQVTDDIGAPHRGIIVWAERGTVNRQGETNAEGFYELRDLSPGIYKVTAQGISWTGPGWSNVEAEAGAEEVNFVIPRTGTIRGRVVEAATGEPISTFEVMTPPGVFRWTGFQDIEGRFEINGLPSGERSVYARADGYATGYSEPITLASGETLEDVVVALEEAGSISVRVVGPGGDPVRDATVVTDGAMPSFGEVPRTDGNGTLRIGDAPPGLHTLYASHPDYAPGSVQANIRAGEVTEAEIHLSRGAILRGTISRNGDPLQDVRIELNQWIGENEIGYNQEANSGKDGNYEFKGIPAGELVLRVNPMFGAQGRVIEMPLLFAGSEEKSVNISVDQGTIDVAFDIEMGDDLIARDGTVWVEIEYALDSGGIERFYTPAQVGSDIRIEGLRPGAATLRARYSAPSNSEVLSEIDPREIVIEDSTENRAKIDFTSPD